MKSGSFDWFSGALANAMKSCARALFGLSLRMTQLSMA